MRATRLQGGFGSIYLSLSTNCAELRRVSSVRLYHHSFASSSRPAATIASNFQGFRFHRWSSHALRRLHTGWPRPAVLRGLYRFGSSTLKLHEHCILGPTDSAAFRVEDYMVRDCAPTKSSTSRCQFRRSLCGFDRDPGEYVRTAKGLHTVPRLVDLNSSPEELLGDGLLSACLGCTGVNIDDLLDERVAATGRHPITILECMMRVAASNDNADVVAFCLGRCSRIIAGSRCMTEIAGNGSFTSHKVLIRAKAVDIDYCTDDMGPMLSNATTLNHLAWARFCLEEGAHADWSYVDGYKLVIAAAAEEGSQDMVELFLEYKVKLEGSGAIVLAAGAGRTEMVRFLLAEGADVNEVGVEDYDDKSREHVGTPLHRAARNGHVETVKLLIGAGADLTRLDFRGRTPEMLAKQYGQTEILIELQGKELNASLGVCNVF